MTDRTPIVMLDPTGTPGQVPTIDPTGTLVEWAAPVGGGGTLLAIHSYHPGSATVPVLPTSDADIDATNLKVTFTAPASGAVLVKVSLLGLVTPPASIGSAVHQLTLREGAGQVAGSDQRIFLLGADDKPLQLRVAYSLLKTGLTPGNSYTYKLGGYNAGTGTCYVGYGSTLGPALFEVLAA